MDPHGIREALVIEQANQAGYFFDEIISSLPFPVRIRKSYYIRKNLPFTYPLPKRIDETFQGRTGLLAYDLIIISGVDIHEFSPEEQLNLISYVEHGGAIIFTGGSYAFEKSDGTYYLIEDIFPVEIEFPEKKIRISNPAGIGGFLKNPETVKLNKQHPACKGLSRKIGKISFFHPVKLKKRAEIVARCGDYPVIATTEYKNGRTCAITAIPDYDNLKGPVDQSNFFEHSEYDDLMRNLIMWLMKKEKEIIIKEFQIKKKKSGQWELLAELESSREKTKKAVFEIHSNNFFNQACGRTLDFSNRVFQKNLEIKGTRVKFNFQLPVQLQLPPVNIYKMVLSVQYGKDVDRKIKNMNVDPYEPVVHRRDVVIETKNPAYISIENLEHEYVFMPGQSLRFQITSSPQHLEKLVIEIRDDKENTVFHREQINPGGSYLFEYRIGNWRRGLYTLRATCITRLQSYFSEYQFAIIHVEPVEDLLFVAPVHVNGLTEKRIREDVSDRVSKGFNCLISGKVMGSFGERFYKNILYYRYLAQFEYNMYLWGEYEGLTCIVDHGPWYLEEGKNPNVPCILTDDFTKKTFEYVKPIFERAEKIPALLSMEILDEPHALPSNICRCEKCLETFRKKYGYEMPGWSEVENIRGKKRYDFFEFLGDYYEKGFRDTYNAVLKYRSRVQANHVFALVGAGQYSTHFSFTDDLKWFPYCDTFEFDCYNYMYAHFAGAEKAKFHQFHFAFARYRNLAGYYKKQLGFFVQLDDRDYPHDIEPIKAPCEILYTAIGQNAKTFHLMYKPSFSNVFGLRQERWELFGKELKRIRRASPLLKKMNKPQAKIAMFFPHTNWVINPQEKQLPPGYVGIGFYHKEERPFNRWFPTGYTPFNAYEFFFRNFGECDVIEERLVARGHFNGYKMIALLATDFIHQQAAEKIEEFVKNGGILLVDRLPSFNQNGERISFMNNLEYFSSEPLFDGIEIKKAIYGSGKVYFLTADLDQIYTDILVSDDTRKDNLLKEKFQQIVFDREGIFPHCLSTNTLVEASLLNNNEFICITVVNHSHKTEKTTVKIFYPDYEVNFAFDLITFEKIPLRKTENGIEIDCELEDLSGRFVGLYHRLAENVEIEGKVSYRRGDYLYLKLLPISNNKVVNGEFLCRVKCVNPEGNVDCDKIISINSNGYILGKAIAENEITGIWSLEVELLHSGVSKKITWSVKEG
ncbi:MAG: glutamine amidotransferase [Candidatus Omnitrophica bacterium]|nr:glutamine amidotransferase [Candidatus Omnitrophota bacterium]